MRKIYLFFIGALLAMPAFSQGEGGEYNKKFERHPEDAKLIYYQYFEVPDGVTPEQAYTEWSTTPVDTIHELVYYNRRGSGDISGKDIYDGSSDWEIFAVRTDSTSPGHEPGAGIIMYHGVETTSSTTEKQNRIFDADEYKIVGDGGNDQARNDAFAQYGENGGKYYFQYTPVNPYQLSPEGASSSHYTSGTHSTAKYRRTLYIRGLEIEDYSPYRLTFYLKTEKLKSWQPRFFADVMRGYFHQRETFSMGIKSGKKYDMELTSSSDFKDGQWQKYTLMTYYINDSVADGYTFQAGYSWGKDWPWHPDESLWPDGKTLEDNEKLYYIKQPDKYFIRFAFATDSVIYSIDNITLTKSWIGGCEYYNDMIRVDFGYKTNLSDLVKEAYAKSNLPYVEVPDDEGKYFEVWGLKKNGNPDDVDAWEEVYIRSAEYHNDGFMYMFTDYYDSDGDGEDDESYKFSDYDQVLVTFHNPTDLPELTLKYTGDKYPKPHDAKWVEDGKIVPDFYNEVATPNPFVFTGVKSKDALNPIMMKAPYEDGAFGLDNKTRELRFKFSRKVECDKVFVPGGNTSNVIATVGTEYWAPSWDENTSELVLTRPNDYQADLKGDYEIKIIQISAKGIEGYNNVTLNYHFGSFDKNPQEAAVLYHSDWRAALEGSTTQELVPVGSWVYDCYAATSSDLEIGKHFYKGDNQKHSKTCLNLFDYPLDDMDNCGFYVSSRQKMKKGDEYSGNIWTVVEFDTPGDYTIKFKAAGYDKLPEEISESDGGGYKTYLKFYPKPNKEELTFNDFEGVANKQQLGEIIPTTKIAKNDARNKDIIAKWPTGTELCDFGFTVPSAGKYVFEWVNYGGHSSGYGVLIGNFFISNKGANDLSVKYVKKLLSAVKDAQDKLDAITDVKYQGADLNALNTAKAQAAAYEGNFPSQYDSVVANINAKIEAMNLRMDTVDLFYSTEKKVADKLALLTGDSLNLTVYQTLNNHKTANANLVCSTKSNAELTAQIKAYEAEMDAIDDRLALMEKFDTRISETKALIDAKDARKDYDEYGVMQTSYNTALTVNKYTTTDAQLTAAIDALVADKNGYWFKLDYFVAKTRQIKDLYALADTLGYDYAGFGGKKDSIKSLIDALEDDDAALSNVLREASILEIYKLYAENDAEKLKKYDSLDVSALIPNYFMYNEAKVDRDMDISSAGTWRIIKSKDNTTAFPGWTVNNGGTMFPGQTAMDWSVDGHVFIGGLYITGSTGTVSYKVDGLPLAYYRVGMLMDKNDMATTSFTAKTDSATVTKAGEKSNFERLFTMDSIRITKKSALTFTYAATKASSSSAGTSGNASIKGAYLMLTNPDTKVNYTELVAAQQTKLTEAITLVDAPVQEVGVEYFTLGGIKINAPKSGEILIRKTTREGKVTVDKVLIK